MDHLCCIDCGCSTAAPLPLDYGRPPQLPQMLQASASVLIKVIIKVASADVGSPVPGSVLMIVTPTLC